MNATISTSAVIIGAIVFVILFVILGVTLWISILAGVVATLLAGGGLGMRPKHGGTAQHS